MVQVAYTPPGPSARMKLRRAHMDVAEEMNRVRPLSPEYKTLEGLAGQIAASYLELFGEPILPVNVRGERAGGYP